MMLSVSSQHKIQCRTNKLYFFLLKVFQVHLKTKSSWEQRRFEEKVQKENLKIFHYHLLIHVIFGLFNLTKIRAWNPATVFCCTKSHFLCMFGKMS